MDHVCQARNVLRKDFDLIQNPNIYLLRYVHNRNFYLKTTMQSQNILLQEDIMQGQNILIQEDIMFIERAIRLYKMKVHIPYSFY